MAAIKTAAFEGRVVFHTRHASLGSLESIDQFVKLATEVDAPFAEKYASELAYLLVLTPQIEFSFHGDENPMLSELKEFWEKYQKATGEKAVLLAIAWRKETSYVIMGEWVKAVNNASTPYRDPVTAPYEALTPEQKAEADDPESFLASNAANLQKAS